MLVRVLATSIGSRKGGTENSGRAAGPRVGPERARCGIAHRKLKYTRAVVIKKRSISVKNSCGETGPACDDRPTDRPGGGQIPYPGGRGRGGSGERERPCLLCATGEREEGQG